jgi:catechol 2,3-dioxygenase-like lactoylglutathione lyase family enzyme
MFQEATAPRMTSPRLQANCLKKDPQITAATTQSGVSITALNRGIHRFANTNTCAHNPKMNAKSKLLRMDNVLIVVDDLDAAKAFFVELGMELEGEAPVEGRWVDRVVGLNNVRADIAMMRTPDGHSRLELTKFHTPPAVRAEPESAPANTLGIRRIMFAVEDIDEVVARLRSHGAELVGEIAQYEDIYRLCFLRGPEGIIIGLAEPLSKQSAADILGNS